MLKNNFYEKSKNIEDKLILYDKKITLLYNKLDNNVKIIDVLNAKIDQNSKQIHLLSNKIKVDNETFY